MASPADSPPTDLAAAHALIIAQREALIVAEAQAQNAEAEARHRALLIEQMKFTIAKLRHEKFGPSAERGAFHEQLELALADMEEDASEAEAKAQMAAAAAAAAKIEVQAFERRKLARRPLPEHLRAHRLFGAFGLPLMRRDLAQDRRGCDGDAGAHSAPVEGDPARAREVLLPRVRKASPQPPAPSHPIARGRAGPGLLAHVLFSKYGLHLPPTARLWKSSLKHLGASLLRRWNSRQPPPRCCGLRNPTQGGHGFRRKADSNPMIADSG